MGLPVRQRRVLENIENTLRGSDPRLAALFAIFARLARDEEMPRVEQLRRTASRLRLRLRLAFPGRRFFGRLLPRPRAVLFFPLAIGLTVASIVFAVTSSSSPDCGQVAQVGAVAGHAHASKLCKPEPEPFGIAH